MKKISRILTVMVLALLLVVPSAQAFQLQLTDNFGNFVQVVDNGVGDNSGALGVISYNGPVGPNWVLNVTTAVTKPFLGSAGTPKMDLNSINSSTAAGTLTILMSENNYGPAQLLNKISANLAVGGTTQGNVQFNLWMDDTNGYPNDLGDLLASTGVLTGVPFVGSGSGSGPAFDGDEGFNLYSLTLETIITHGRGGVLTSFDIAAQIPEPATLILLGFGLLGVAAIRRKR